MEPEKKSNGALMGSIIIIVILIIGGIYFWQTKLKEKTEEPATTVGQNSGVSSASNLEANLNSVDLENLDKGI